MTRTPTLKLPPGMTWMALDVVGVGHLLPRRATRFVCDLHAPAMRFAWPMRSRCAVCVAKLEEGR